MLLSVVMPVYNEQATIREIIARIRKVELPHGLEREIVIVDDFSTDNTRNILKELEAEADLRIFYKDANGGKGSAVRQALKEAAGDFVIIQDADLEYDPDDYKKILPLLLDGKADVVYGSRFVGSEAKRVLFYWHSVGNKILTSFSNALTNLNLTDMETCYKAFNRSAVDGIKNKLTSDRFGLEPEITALVAKGRFKIYEVGIAYDGRTYQDGKKINWRDGVAAFWHIIKFNLLK